MATSFDRTLRVVGAILSLNLVTIVGAYFIAFDEVLKYKILLVQFLLVLQSLLFFAARYVWIRLCPPLFKSSNIVERLCLVFVVVVLMLAQCSLFLGTIFTSEEPHWISIATYSALGTLFVMTTVVFLFDVTNFITTRLLRRKVTSQLGLRIRAFLILLSTMALVITALFNGCKEPEIKRIRIPLKNLPVDLNGLTIVQLSDVHVGPTVGKRMLESVVRMSNSLRPDLVVLTGDLADGTVYQMRQAMKPLLKLKARYGVYFTTGWYSKRPGVSEGYVNNYLLKWR